MSPRPRNQARRRAKDLRRMKIHAKTNGICYLCGAYVDLKTMTVDHKVPVSKGGSGKMENLFATHKWCNNLKSDTTI